MNRVFSPNDIFAIYPLAIVFIPKFHCQVSHTKNLEISDHENRKLMIIQVLLLIIVKILVMIKKNKFLIVIFMIQEIGGI